MRRQRLVDEVREVWLLEHEWHGLREPACPICSAGHIVHDHGTEDGAGLACRERRTAAGLLRGECLAPRRVTISPADDTPEFVCEGCGARVTDDGGDALLGWARDENGEFAFCASCSSENGGSPASAGGA